MSNLINNNMAWYISRIPEHKKITQEEEYKLIKAAQSGDEEATKFLIENNQRLILPIASLFSNVTGMELIDLIQEGNLGLMEAIKKFDFEKEKRLSTYNTIWIKQSILRALKSNGLLIRFPEYVYSDNRKYEQAKKDLREKLDREPTDEEIIQNTSLTESKIKVIKQLHTSVWSLNYPSFKYINTKTEEEHEMIELIESSYTILEELEKKELEKDISKAIDNTPMKERYKEITKVYYGIGSDIDMTYEEVGNLYNVSRQRVQEIVKKSLYKVRNSDDLYNLALYLPESNMGYEIINKTEQDTKKLSKKR